jgi:hypothetical protein
LPYRHIDAHLLESHYFVERTVVSIGQQSIASLEPSVQRAEQRMLIGKLSLAGPDRCVEMSVAKIIDVKSAVPEQRR